METDEEQPLRRGQGRSKAAVREDQVSEASSSDPMGGDVGMESMQEPPVPFTAPEGSGSFQTQSRMLDFSNWVDMISQAVMGLASGPSSQTRNVESEAIVERARRLGAQEFQGNLDPSAADEWFQAMEGVFEVMHCSEEQKLNIATFMLGGNARDWWRAIKARQSRGVRLTWKDFQKEFHQQYYPK